MNDLSKCCLLHCGISRIPFVHLLRPDPAIRAQGRRQGGGGGGGLGDQAILPGIQAISPSHFCDDVVIVSLTSPGLATLKSVQDSDNVGTGKKIVNTQSAGVLLKITKKATTANVMCRVFVLSVVWWTGQLCEQ